MTTPKPILERRKLLKESASGYTFQAVDYLGYLLVGFDSYNHVYVVNFVFSSKDFNVKFLAEFFQYLCQSIANLTSQHSTTILDAPNNVDLKLIHRMAARLEIVFHINSYGSQCQKLRKPPVKVVFWRDVTNILFAGIKPAQGYQIPRPA